jgi:manganese/iron transport system permease protein
VIELLLEPFSYSYMSRAIWVSALVGALCGALSGFLVLKGWALMGDALSHAVVPGVAIAAILGFPYAAGAFLSALLAAAGMAGLRRLAPFKEDVSIGLVFTSLFGLGLLIVSLRPTSVSVQTITFGNILAISDADALQVVIVSALAMGILVLRWKDLMISFFDPAQARTVGINPDRERVLFFILLSAASVAALQAVGAILVIAMVVTPGATAYLLTDRFGRMLVLSGGMGFLSAATGAYLSFFLDGATGAIIVLIQTGLFALAFLFAPKHGRIAAWRSARMDAGKAAQ